MHDGMTLSQVEGQGHWSVKLTKFEDFGTSLNSVFDTECLRWIGINFHIPSGSNVADLLLVFRFGQR